MKDSLLPFYRTFRWATAGTALLFFFLIFSPADLFSPYPVNFGDYTHHFYKSFAAGKFLSRSGSMSGYDPFFMAGYPGGGVMSLDDKLWEFTAWVFTLGFSPPVAFKLQVFFSFLLCPLLVYFISRNFGMEEKISLGAVWGWVVIWFLDPTMFNFWKIGIYSWLPASLTALLAVSLFYRYLSGGRLGSTGIIALALAFPLAFWMHVFSAVVVALGLPAVFYCNPRRKEAARLWPVAVLWVLAGLPLLIPLWYRTGQLLSVSRLSRGVFQSDFKNLVGELLLDKSRLLLFREGTHRFKLAILLLGAWGVRSDPDRDRSRFLGIFSLILFFVSYLGSGMPLLKETQPYRCLIPLLALLLPFAIMGCGRVIEILSRSNQEFKRLNILLVLLVVPTLVFSLAGRFKYRGIKAALSADERDLWKTIQKDTSRKGRILFPIDTGSLFPAALPYFVPRELVGGFFQEVYSKHNFVNASNSPDVMFNQPLWKISEERMKEYLIRYNIQWVVTSGGEYYRQQPKLFRELTRVGKWTLFKTLIENSFFISGSGEVLADYDSIKVKSASLGEIVLKYHWDPDLTVNPPMRIMRYNIGDDPVGFIKIQNNQASGFELKSEK